MRNCQRPRLVQVQLVFMCELCCPSDRKQASSDPCPELSNINLHLVHRSQERIHIMRGRQMPKGEVLRERIRNSSLLQIEQTGPGERMANGCGGPPSLFMLQRSGVLNLGARANHTLFIAGGYGISGGHSEPQLRSWRRGG